MYKDLLICSLSFGTVLSLPKILAVCGIKRIACLSPFLHHTNILLWILQHALVFIILSTEEEEQGIISSMNYTMSSSALEIFFLVHHHNMDLPTFTVRVPFTSLRTYFAVEE